MTPARGHGGAGVHRTGVAKTTALTWLFVGNGGGVGTWRTEDGGVTWKQVAKNEKGHSYYQIHQPDMLGTVFMADASGVVGAGVLRSTDFGKSDVDALVDAARALSGSGSSGGDRRRDVLDHPRRQLQRWPLALGRAGRMSAPRITGWRAALAVVASLGSPLFAFGCGSDAANAVDVPDGAAFDATGGDDTFTADAGDAPGADGSAVADASSSDTRSADTTRPEDPCTLDGGCAPGTWVDSDASGPPLLYVSCIRGDGLGFWRSTNGGVDWTRYEVTPAPTGGGQQFYPALVDPYDARHLLMAGHATDLVIESADGGETWRAVGIDARMKQEGGTTGIVFIDSGSAPTTRTTWLWLAAQSGGKIGTWRTEDAGKTWTQVDKNEHINGATSVYQPGGGVMIMAGDYSALGAGLLRSTDYGKTWAHLGLDRPETIVVGTSKSLFAMYGWAIGAGSDVDPSLEIGAQPGTGTWKTSVTPAEMNQGPAQGAVTSDGKHDIVLVANYNAGMWRYVEE